MAARKDHREPAWGATARPDGLHETTPVVRYSAGAVARGGGRGVATSSSLVAFLGHASTVTRNATATDRRDAQSVTYVYWRTRPVGGLPGMELWHRVITGNCR